MSLIPIRRLALPPIFVGLMLLPAIVECQEYGRWSWDGIVGVEGRSTDNLLADESISRYETQSLFLGLGLNGFIAHPAVARFRIGLDTWYTRFPEGGSVDNYRFGGRFDLGLFDRGAVPIRLYYGRAQYSYTDLATDDPITLLGGFPDVSDSYGGRLRIRRSFLRGLLLGFDSTELRFLGDVRGSDRMDRAFVDWSRSSKKIQHHVRVVHDAREYSRVAYGFDTTTLTWDEHGPIAPKWRWDLFAVGIRRRTEYESLAPVTSDTARLRNRFIRDNREGSSLNLGYGFGYASAGSGASAFDHQFDGRYQRRLGSGWELSPFATLTWRDVGDRNITVLQGGLAATWTWNARAWDMSFSSQGAYGQSRFSVADESATQPFWSGSAAMIVGHGRQEGLRKELEISANRNEIRSVGDGDANLPDLGIGFAAAGTQDGGRARFSLIHGWAGGSVSAWAEWRMRMADSLIDDTELRTEGLLANFQLQWRRFSLMLNGGATEFDDFRAVDQELTYYGAALSWNPWRSLRLTGNYREDFRRLALSPDVDSDRIQATLEFQMGKLWIRGEAFQYTEYPDDGVVRRNRGIFWSVRRGFGGWLPIVTGPQRRGVIR